MDKKGRARWGAGGTLTNLQPALAGSMPFRDLRNLLSGFDQVVLKAGSHAIEVYEPGQVRKEAALSMILYVPWGHLAGAN